jgi:hypothetical protein
VIVDLEDLAKGSLADHLEYFIAICYVVVGYVRVGALKQRGNNLVMHNYKTKCSTHKCHVQQDVVEAKGTFNQKEKEKKIDLARKSANFK